LSACLTFCLVVSLSAQTKWTEEYLLRFNAAEQRARQATAPLNPILAQVFQTGALPIRLEDVINMMLDNNLDVRSNRLGPRSSALQTLVFYRVLEPSLRFTGSVSHDTSFSTSQVAGALSLSNLRHQFGAGFAQTLPLGTSVAIDASMIRQSNNSTVNTFNPSYSGVLRFTIGQHLLRDRGRLVNTRQIILGEYNEKLSEFQFAAQIIDLVVQAQKTYWDLVFAADDLKVKQNSLELAQQTLIENRTKVDIGVLAPIDLKQTEYEVADRRQQLIQANGFVVQNEDQIKKLVSSETDPSLFLIRLKTSDSPRRPSSVLIPSLEQAVRIAMENRPELRQAALELKGRNLDVEYTKNQKLPILDVTASFNQNGTGGTRTIRDGEFGGPITAIVPGGLLDAFRQMFSYNYTGYSVGFSMTIPLSNRAAIADYDRARNEVQLSESRLNAVRQQIALEVRTALMQIEQTQASIDATRVARELAQDQAQAERTKYNVGASTLRFVLDEQRNMAQAETAELQSLVSFNKALVDLDKAMGLTLIKNNIEIDKALQASLPVASVSLADRARPGN
jgi:outer membrane protein TolC